MRDIPKDTHFCYLGGLSDADGATSSHVLLDVIHSNPRIEMVKKYTSSDAFICRIDVLGYTVIGVSFYGWLICDILIQALMVWEILSPI